MRAEAVSWDDWSVSNPPPPIVEDDKWHVEFEPNEVKVVSLEQLDDLFRLSIVDSETKVWQAGMSEWQPLRVIAGLDEKPAHEPKRPPPRPPVPQMRTTGASTRPPPPPAIRPSSLATRSTSAPVQPAYVAPASFYPEPVLAASASYPPSAAYAAQVAFAAPVYAAHSVRPLVVSHAPSVAPAGGGFGRFLVGLSLLAGVSITAYRNDFVREGAHAVHQDALYARLESALGGPAFGTPRALEQSLAAQPTFEVRVRDESPARTTIAVPPPLDAPSAPLGTAAGSSTTPVVSLESLAHEQKLHAVTKVEAEEATAAPTRVPSSIQPARPAPAVAKASLTRTSASPKSAAVERPVPVAHKPASDMSERERLNAAIGQSVMQTSAPKAKGNKSKASEYDPLNPNL